MTTKFRDIAAKHRERRMRIRRREMAFAASQVNNNSNHHQHHRSSMMLPTGQVVSHVKHSNPHDVDVCSSISVSSYSSSKDDGYDDDITNETFGETISESVEDESSCQEQAPHNSKQQAAGLLLVQSSSNAKRHAAAAAAYRRKGRSPTTVGKKTTTTMAVSRINVTPYPSNNTNTTNTGKEEPKMASPSWANVQLKKSNNIINTSGNVVAVDSEKNAATDTAAVKVLTPRTRGGAAAAAAATTTGSSFHNNKQRVVRASTGSVRRRFKAASYADRPSAMIVQQSPKMMLESSSSPRILTATTLRPTGSNFLRMPESMSLSPRHSNNNNNNNNTHVAAPAVAKKTAASDHHYDFQEEKKEEYESVVEPEASAPTPTTSTTSPVPPPPLAWSIKLKSTTGATRSSSSRPSFLQLPSTKTKPNACTTAAAPSSDESQGQEDAVRPPPSHASTTASTSTSAAASSSNSSCPPPAAWSVKLRSTRAHVTNTTTATITTTKKDQKLNVRPVFTTELSTCSAFTCDVQSPQTSVSSKQQQQQQQQQLKPVAGKTTTPWAPAAYAKRAAAPTVTTTIAVTTSTFGSLASPLAQTTPKLPTLEQVVVASPAWAQVKLKKTGFDVTADTDMAAVDAESTTAGMEDVVVGDDAVLSPIAAAGVATGEAAGVAVSTLRDDDKKKGLPLSVLAWAQKKWSLKQDEDQEQAENTVSHPVVKNSAPTARALKKQTIVVTTTIEEPAEPVTTKTPQPPTTLDNDKYLQRESAPPAWTLRKLKSTMECESIEQVDDKPVAAALTPKTDKTTTLTPKTASMDAEKNQRRSTLTLPAWVVQNNKARHASDTEQEHLAAHDVKAAVVPTPGSNMEQDQSMRSVTPPPPTKTPKNPIEEEASPLPIWAKVSLKKTGIDVAEQHLLEKNITVETDPRSLDQHQVEKESSTPKVQLYTIPTPKVERFGLSAGAWNPIAVNLPPWAQPTLRNTANNLSEDSFVDENVRKAKGKQAALTVIATENNTQLGIARAAADDAGDPAPFLHTMTSSSDGDGEKFATTMSPWIRAKLKKKIGSDTTVEIWPEDESCSIATSKSPAATTHTNSNVENRGAPQPYSMPAAWPVKLRKTGLYDKELDASAVPTTSTPTANGFSTTKMVPTPLNAKIAPTPVSMSSQTGISQRQMTSWGKTTRTKGFADVPEAENCAPVPAVVALEVGAEDQTTTPQPPWSTMKLRKTGIEVVEPTPGAERVMTHEKSQANQTHPTVLTVMAAPERRTSNIREQPTPRTNAEESNIPTPSGAARAKTPDQSQSNNLDRRSSLWPIAMLRKTGFDVTEQQSQPVEGPADGVERVEENNVAKEAVVSIIAPRAGVVVATSTPKNNVPAPGKNIMDRIDEAEPVNNNPWSMMKLKRTGFDVREEETISEPSFKAQDSAVTSSAAVVEKMEVQKTRTGAAKAVVAEPEQDDTRDEPAAETECDTARQHQPMWAKMKLKKTGMAETTACTTSATTSKPDVPAAGKVRHWKKTRSDVV